MITTTASASPFVIALRGALANLSATPVSAAEAVLAKKLLRDIEHAIGRLEGKPSTEADLISIVCHDLKDPLASIVMGAGFLRKTVSADDAAGKRVIEAIMRSTERMGHVIADFHDLAKLEADRVALDLRPWDLVAILRTATPAFEAKAVERGVRWEVEMPSNSVLVSCDRPRLIQVVSKLVANAIKFTDPAGRVLLRVERVAASQEETGAARISICDTGRGIPPDRLPSIFDHAVNARRTPRDGPGLGLAIAQGLVRLQGGSIDVQSNVGEGSTFSFTLPASPSAPA